MYKTSQRSHGSCCCLLDNHSTLCLGEMWIINEAAAEGQGRGQKVSSFQGQDGAFSDALLLRILKTTFLKQIPDNF
jgi:hypothetical protein